MPFKKCTMAVNLTKLSLRLFKGPAGTLLFSQTLKTFLLWPSDQ